MRGEITAAREARIFLTVRGSNGREIAVNAVLDTGFSDYLPLSPRLLADIGAPQVDQSRAILADGNSVFFDIHRAEVVWDNVTREIPVYAAEGGALIGMALLYGNDITLRVLDGGEVVTTPISA